MQKQQKSAVSKSSPTKSPSDKEAASRLEEHIEAEVARRIGSLVQRGTRDQIVSQVAAIIEEETFSGPIPHPRHLQHYEEICPGAADRLIGMAEDIASFNIKASERAQEAQIADRTLGMKLGFAALCILITGAVVCALVGAEKVAGVLVGAVALGTVGQFIRGRWGRSD